MKINVGGIYQIGGETSNEYIVIIYADDYDIYAYMFEKTDIVISNEIINSEISKNKNYGFCNLNGSNDFVHFTKERLEFNLNGYIGQIQMANLEYLRDCFKETEIEL